MLLSSKDPPLIVQMSESFQDFSWIHDFEADFQKKASLKILNKAVF